MKYPTPKLAQAHKLASMVIAPLFMALAGLIALSQPSVAQEDNQGRSSNAAKPAKSQPEPRGLTKYLGRRIASPMGFQHMDWLSRPERIQEENPQEMLDQLGLKEGLVVCDLGCGDGYHTLQMAPKVGPSGKVIAVDIQPQMLQELSRRMIEQNIPNIDTILGDLWDPKLAEASVDLVLMVDVYHEFSHPVQMLEAIRKSLKPNGLVALVEFRAEDPTVLIRPEHKMPKAQIYKEYFANGFKVAREYDKLPWQHLIFLERDEDWSPKSDR
jgi:ubiquinone/menaquinone biosynthesis C-methylase UbiE